MRRPTAVQGARRIEAGEARGECGTTCTTACYSRSVGILGGNARLLLDEHRRRPFSGSLLELGRAHVFLTHRELRTLAAASGVTLREPETVRLSHDPRLAALECVDDHSFFAMLGFDEVRSLDISDYEGADRIADLNRPLPEPLQGRFDVVLDAGTLQHVFHIPQALANLHTAVKVGGRIVIGMAASHNHVDHGFYMFSPTLFHDYFTANDYVVESAYVAEFHHEWLGGRLHTTPWKIYEYEPGCLDELSYGGFGRRQIALFFVATRQPESTGDRIPQQSYFTRVWATPAAALGPHGDGDSGDRSLAARIERVLARLVRHRPALRTPLLAVKRLRRALHRRKRPVRSART